MLSHVIPLWRCAVSSELTRAEACWISYTSKNNTYGRMLPIT